MSSFRTSACINLVGTDISGHSKTYSPLGSTKCFIQKLDSAIRTDPHVQGRELVKSFQSATNLEGRSDYAAAQIYLGNPNEAIKRLELLEQEEPGHYYIAGNLGTAYELAGDFDKALFWIKEEMRRDPHAHKGTEWLHLSILEAEIAQRKQPNYFESHTILDVDPITAQDIYSRDHPYAKSDIAAISDQLSERLQFIKPTNAAVAALLWDAAAVEAQTGTLENARLILPYAERYGYPATKIKALVKLYDRRIALRKLRQYLLYSVFAFFAVAILLNLYRRGIFVLWRRDSKPASPA